MSKQDTIYRNGWQRYGDMTVGAGPVVRVESLAHLEDQWLAPPIVDADNSHDEDWASFIDGEDESLNEPVESGDGQWDEVYAPKWILPGTFQKKQK